MQIVNCTHRTIQLSSKLIYHPFLRELFEGMQKGNKVVTLEPNELKAVISLNVEVDEDSGYERVESIDPLPEGNDLVIVSDIYSWAMSLKHLNTDRLLRVAHNSRGEITSLFPVIPNARR